VRQVSLESKRVLLVWSDAAMARSAVAALEAAGRQARHELDGLSGLISVESWAPALVILDWTQRLVSGPTFLAALEAGLPSPPPVIALVERSEATAALGSRAAAVLTKPFELHQLVECVHRLLAG
jgi:DNA-binding response OmpR family regulator